MESGKLRHPIEIQSATETRDDHGGVVRAWATVATVWGRVRPLTARGREYVTAQQVQAQITHEIEFRWHPTGVTPRDRMVHRDRVFEVEFVVDMDERRHRQIAYVREAI